ncbi:MAG: threonine/serine exporter family protein [Bacteroidaceae bacterium]|nr:threonine/serine exporter family protein [Bacteroidaceae bacterium]
MSACTAESEKDVLDLAQLAGHILLENGAEISRVEESMERIASFYGVSVSNFFVLSNGIFTTGSTSYAKVEFIPFKGAQLERVVAVNQISRDIQKGMYSIEQARERLLSVRTMQSSSWLTRVFGSAVGAGFFAMIFGGSVMDSLASFVAGLLLWAFVVFVSAPYMSKTFGNILGGALAVFLCIILHSLGFGENLGNMIVASIIPLVPGVPFANGIRDIANEDYISGTTRLMDALMVFFCIAMGASSILLVHGWVNGSIIELHGMVTDPHTASLLIQWVAAFFGTMGFAVIFGVPARHYVSCAVVASLGWVLYLALYRHTMLGIPVSTFFATVLVAALARAAARLCQTPATIFIITGIFPMVPGGGLFWTTYYTVSSQLHESFAVGFMSVKVTIAIVLGIVFVNELPKRLFRSFKRRSVNSTSKENR